MTPVRRRLTFIAVFVIGFALVSSVSLMFSISAGLGPGDAGDPQPTNSQKLASTVGGAIVSVLWFPVIFVRSNFFAGRTLPGSDWIWILGCGGIYAVFALVIYEWTLKGKSPPN